MTRFTQNRVFPFSVPATMTDGDMHITKVVSWMLLVDDDVASATFQLIFVVIAPSRKRSFTTLAGW